MIVLFVCSGNICRSAMADAVCRHEVRRRGLDEIEVRSAGTLGIVGAPASPEAIQALDEINMDLTRHRSSALTSSGLEAADLIVVMDRTHERVVRETSPASASKMVRLLAFEGGSRADDGAGELDDPVGRPLAVFRRQRSRIVASVEHLLDQLADDGD